MGRTKPYDHTVGDLIRRLSRFESDMLVHVTIQTSPNRFQSTSLTRVERTDWVGGQYVLELS